MSTTTRSIALGASVALVIIAAVFGWQYFLQNNTEQVVDERYSNEEYGFSFAIPRGFEVWEAENIVVVENELGDGIQIVITPIVEDILVLTEERTRADVPDLVMQDSQAVEIEADRTGLVFTSDNEAFDGASREVWFVYPGPQGLPQLYQLSTYARLDQLLESIFISWEFF
ncbi:MAG: hypothetical protein Q8P58_01610 [Candidatus Adlerbacteria bacterium]|nr:hypothetical protein [Candidatus Adlerbacteria bacterium]